MKRRTHSYQHVAVIRLVNQEPEFRIVSCVHDNTIISMSDPVQALQSVILAKRKGKNVLHRIVNPAVDVALPVKICIAYRDRFD